MPVVIGHQGSAVADLAGRCRVGKDVLEQLDPAQPRHAPCLYLVEAVIQRSLQHVEPTRAPVDHRAARIANVLAMVGEGIIDEGDAPKAHAERENR